LSAAERAGHQQGRTIYYGLRIPSNGRMERSRRAWVYGEEGWRSMPRGGSVPPPLVDLPEGVFSASMDEGSCGIYWQESGEEAEIEQIYGVLERILVDD
jgi:hypothetical protein